MRLLLPFLLFLSACSLPTDHKNMRSKDLYKKGVDLSKNEEYKEAAKIFLNLDHLYPNDPLANHAQLMAGYASFMARDYNDAIDAFSVFSKLQPTHSHCAYAYYMIGMCYYAQTQHIERDHSVIEKAGQAFEELIEKHPHTVYAKDANLKIDFIRAHLSAKELTIGRYYQSENNCVAAMTRFNELIKRFPKTPQVPEALYRLIECQIALGLKEETVTTLQVLSHNFPRNPWFLKAKKIIQ